MTSLYGTTLRPGQGEATAEAIFEDKKVKSPFLKYITKKIILRKTFNKLHYMKVRRVFFGSK